MTNKQITLISRFLHSWTFIGSEFTDALAISYTTNGLVLAACLQIAFLNFFPFRVSTGSDDTVEWKLSRLLGNDRLLAVTRPQNTPHQHKVCLEAWILYFKYKLNKRTVLE